MPQRHLLSIQYLRGIAALLVVFHHSFSPLRWIVNPFEGADVGGFGVQIFFVISGFVMFVAARDEGTINFYVRRIIRVVPLYWLALAGYLILDMYYYESIGFNQTTPAAFLKSMLFIPHYSPRFPGEIWPYLVPGWTLNYEMFFYLVFGLTALVPKWRNTALFSTMLVLVATGLVLRTNDPIVLTYTSHMLVLFLAGVAIGMAHTQGRLPAIAAWLLPLSAIGLLSGDVVDLAALQYLLAAFAVAGAVALESNHGAYVSPVLGLIGDASYSIYLSHVAVLGITAGIFNKLDISGPFGSVAWVVHALVLTTAAGIVVHRVVERPLGAYLSGLWKRRSGRALANA